MKQPFGQLPTGEAASLYTLNSGLLKAEVSDAGAILVSLWVPDKNGRTADVVLGFDRAEDYAADCEIFFGATVGRSCNRIAGARLTISGQEYVMAANNYDNNLHSGTDFFHHRLWEVKEQSENRIVFHLFSPHGDQGLPGNAHIYVTYFLDGDTLKISYDAVSDRDTLFNLTNHSFFNMAGHENQHKAYDQLLCIPGRHYTVTNAQRIPTGELRSVAGTAMDFRSPKPVGQDAFSDYESVKLAKGFDHSYEVFCNPCATLTDPESGRSMAISTDCPGLQFYAAGSTRAKGKNGVMYVPHCGVCLETQYYPDAVHHPEWTQPIYRAGEKYHSETWYRFTW